MTSRSSYETTSRLLPIAGEVARNSATKHSLKPRMPPEYQVAQIGRTERASNCLVSAAMRHSNGQAESAETMFAARAGSTNDEIRLNTILKSRRRELKVEKLRW